MATNTKRARRKERNRANVKARSSAIRNDRFKRYAMFVLVVAAVAAVIVTVAIVLPDPAATTTISHGG